MNIKDLDNKLNLTLKALGVVALTGVIITSASLYSKFGHTGPSCNQSEMQGWLGKKGEIISIHESKNQPIEGTTKCYGTYVKPDGSYGDWEGDVIATSKGNLGRAQ